MTMTEYLDAKNALHEKKLQFEESVNILRTAIKAERERYHQELKEFKKNAPIQERTNHMAHVKKNTFNLCRILYSLLNSEYRWDILEFKDEPIDVRFEIDEIGGEVTFSFSVKTLNIGLKEYSENEIN